MTGARGLGVYRVAQESNVGRGLERQSACLTEAALHHSLTISDADVRGKNKMEILMFAGTAESLLIWKPKLFAWTLDL